ncbi:hypothetical protein HY991_01015 [Candidatus Micrarchaeota archaeon]|nr:hypothetical protein [Candidatus Micrarchaeota archaeon]
MEYVFSIASGEYEKLKKILEENPYDNVSFAKTGYTLRDSQGLGLPEGSYVLYFSAEEEVGKKLANRLAEKAEERLKKIIEGKNLSEEQKAQILNGLKARELSSLKAIEGKEKEEIIERIKSDEVNAAQGFGSIFG